MDRESFSRALATRFDILLGDLPAFVVQLSKSTKPVRKARQSEKLMVEDEKKREE